MTGGLHLTAGDVSATTRQRLAGTALVFTQQAADRAVAVLAIALAAASVLTVTRLALLAGFAAAHRRRVRRLPPSVRHGPATSRTSRW